MHEEREFTVAHVPFWYRAALRGSVFGLLLGTIVGVVLAGLWGLLVLALFPLLLVFRLFEFERKRMKVRITDAFEVLEGDVAVAVPLERVLVREHRGSTVDLRVTFPYRGRIWQGTMARKDPLNAITASDHDDAATYAQIRGILNSK